ncbi:MAG TPA: ATP-binding protein [Candidatus Limnocylindria bacterium]|nr:ATP-binding protein [Candidatus Limnocylindria bacterium]
MRISRADVLALLIVLGAAITGVVVWNHGTVDLGMTLRVIEGTEAWERGIAEADAGPVVIVDDVTPGGNAQRNGFYPETRIIGLTRTDERPVAGGEPLDPVVESCPDPDMDPYMCGYQEAFPWDPAMGPYVEGPVEGYRLPIEAAPANAIATATAGQVDSETSWLYGFAAIDRAWIEYALDQSIWLSVLSLLAGVLAWRFMAHGLAGPFGRDHALVVASAVAVPGLILPAVQVGTAAGIAAGLLVPGAVALVLGVSLARSHPDEAWVHTAIAASLVAVALAVVIVVRSLTSPSLGSGDFGIAVLVVALIALAPAAVSASAPGRSARERASLLTLGLVPGAALLVTGPQRFDPVLPLVLVGLLLAWYVLPFERVLGAVGGGLSRVRSTAPIGSATGGSADTSSLPVVGEPIVPANLRDLATIALFTVVVLVALFRQDSSLAVLGVLLAGMVGVAVRAGALGEHWADAAIPLGAAVGLPVAVSGYSSSFYDATAGGLTAAIALVGLSVADVLASRHSDPLWRQRLMYWSIGLAAVPVILWLVSGGGGMPLLIAMASLVPLVPGLPVAFADDHDEPRAISTRLETLVVALTLFVSTLVLTPLAWVPLVAWFIAIVVWRRFTLAPLLGLAQRTQLQRDVAVAAAETERARLAADLHDDALQQLTMLVRTLDEGGHEKEAAEAREIATKLRSVVGDLRLPILDDLGAGAALEWLVERVEPLAGGPVRLERSDETRPPANVELAVFRVAQEALTNAIKHGRPPIAVRYDVRSDGRVTLAIDDAGQGIGSDAAEEAPKAGHFGLVNMQQRAEQIGALLDVRRWPAGGTRVALEWRPQ